MIEIEQPSEPVSIKNRHSISLTRKSTNFGSKRRRRDRSLFSKNSSIIEPTDCEFDKTRPSSMAVSNSHYGTKVLEFT